MFNRYISAEDQTEPSFTNKTANSPNNHDKHTPSNTPRTGRVPESLKE